MTAKNGHGKTKAGGNRARAARKGEGRPSAYHPSFAEWGAEMCKLGATDSDLARVFKVTTQTIYNWQVEHPEFLDAIMQGKDFFDDKIERSLAHRALGYTFNSEKVFQHQGEIVRAEVLEHIPPDVTAQIFWLKNRRKEQWNTPSEVSTQAFSLIEQLVRMATARMIDGQARESGDGRDHGDGSRMDPVAALLRAPGAAGNT